MGKDNLILGQWKCYRGRCSRNSNGPWSGQATDWLNTPPITGRRSSCILITPKEPIQSQVGVICNIKSKGDTTLHNPKIFSRPDGEVYIGGLADEQIELPPKPSQVQANEESNQDLW